MRDVENDYLTMLMAEEEGYAVGLPDGVFFLDEGSDVLRLGDELCQMVIKKGYRRVYPPLFEFYDTYSKGGSLDISRRSFSFKDKDGSLLALRYDMTTPIARMVAQRYEEGNLPLRLCYYGDVFREQPFHQGKPRQMRQLGIEIVGGERIETDAEMVSLLIELLQKIDKSYRLVIGDIRIYHQCLERLSLSNMQKKAIHHCFHLKDKPSLFAILEKVSGADSEKELLGNLMDFLCDFHSLSEERFMKFGQKAEEVYANFVELAKKLPPSEKDKILLDLGMVKDFGYYSSLMIEGYISQSGYAVCHGGRYDGLYASFGKNFPAVGFALDLSYTFR